MAQGAEIFSRRAFAALVAASVPAPSAMPPGLLRRPARIVAALPVTSRGSVDVYGSKAEASRPPPRPPAKAGRREPYAKRQEILHGWRPPPRTQGRLSRLLRTSEHRAHLGRLLGLFELCRHRLHLGRSDGTSHPLKGESASKSLTEFLRRRKNQQNPHLCRA